jgi:hypothetical protein
MRKSFLAGLTSLIFFLPVVGQEKEFIYTGNPIVRDLYTADPSARVWTIDGKERLYVYPSHDIDPPRGCDLMDKYHVYSTEDMIHWTDHGQILEAADVPWAKPLADNGKFMWAPDCIYRNGKYYFYFPKPKEDPWNDTWHIGIAVSDKPASDFVVLDEPLKGTAVSWKQNNTTVAAPGLIDPCLFIDDDGQIYFYFGGGGHCFGGKLKDNMIEVEGELQEMNGLYNFHEGTWVFKRNGIYYLTYADGNSSGNQLRYAVSNSPLGPWSHKGVYLKPTSCDTSHGSVVEYKGQWWAFYHTADLSGTGLLRSICVDSLFFNNDGSIQTVVQTKDMGTPYQGEWRIVPGTVEAEDFNEGGQGIAYWDNTRGNKYSQYRPHDWVDINLNRRYSIIYVTDTESKEYINYSFEVSESGLYSIDFVIGSVAVGAEEKFYLEFDQKKVLNPEKYTAPYAEIEKAPVVTVSDIELSKGRHTLTFYPMGNMNFDKYTFSKLTGISKTDSRLSVSVFPNPSQGIWRVQSSRAGIIHVSDISGKSIITEKMNDLNHTIDISNYAPGIYILFLQLEDTIYKKKLIKQ